MSPLKASDVAECPYGQGIGTLWLGTVASIPAGWEVASGGAAANDASYTKPNKIGRFAKGVTNVGDAPGTLGGASTHAHAASASAHTHNLESGGGDSGWDGTTGNSWAGTPAHTHTAGTDATAAFDAEASAPSHIEGIPIVYTLKGGNVSGPRIHDYAESALPTRKIIMTWDSTAVSVPAGWTRCNGATVNGVTVPNLLGKYLRGIPNTGTNPGGTGGSATHTHNANHSHATSGPSDTSGWTYPGGVGVSSPAHTHTTTVSAVTTDAGSTEPENITTHYICFTGHGSNAAAHALGVLQAHDLDGSLTTARGIVAGWGHPLAEIVAGWGHCDGGAWTAPTGYGSNKPNMLGRFVKHVNANAGTTGGADTHGHTGGVHTHTSGGPSAITARISGQASGSPVSLTNNPDVNSHTHNLTTITWSGNAPGKSTSAASSLPPYSEVAWLIRD